jgi:hypothetical protein
VCSREEPICIGAQISGIRGYPDRRDALDRGPTALGD